MILLQIGLYLAAINLFAFGMFGLDKRRAERGDWRVSERTLLSLAAVGGAAGAIAGQRYFRHKTRKEPFRTLLWMTPFWQVLALAAWIAFGPLVGL